MANIPVSTLCDEDNTSIAARSLLTLNTSRTNRGQGDSHEEDSHVHENDDLHENKSHNNENDLLTNKSKQCKIVVLQNKSLEKKSPNSMLKIKSAELSQNVEMCVDATDSTAKEDIVSVRIDRSSGNPDVQILKTNRTEEFSTLPVRIDRSSENPDMQILKTDKTEEVGTEVFGILPVCFDEENSSTIEESNADDDEIFGMVTAVIKKRKDICVKKYLSLCKVSDVTVVYINDNNMCVSGTLQAVNTIHSLLEVFYYNIVNENEEKSDAVNGEEISDDQQADMLSIKTEEVTCTSTSPEIEKDGMSTSSSSTSCQSDKDGQMFIAASSSNTYRCTHCVESFESTKELVEHCEKFHREGNQQSSTSTSKSFKCPQCSKIFRTNMFLTLHLEEVHGPNVCPLCGKEFALKRYLSMHMKRHSDGNKKHACEVCGWKFLERYKLRLHMESHKPKSEKNLPHVCDVCKRQFYNKATLDDHKNTHTGNRPFICTICSSSFSHRIGLKRHLVTHAKTKPFKCGVCLKEFGFKTKLDEHLITHTGEGKYICDHCGKIFTTKASLKRHTENCISKSKGTEQVAVDGSDAVFMCGICSLVFDTLEKASVHASKHET